MFSPLYMGTNHMLGADTYVPLTTNRPKGCRFLHTVMCVD